MIWSTIFIEALIFTAFFTALVTIPTIKHPEVGVHNYPPEIQKEYFKTHPRVETAPLSKRTLLFKGCGIILFSALLLWGALAAGAKPRCYPFKNPMTAGTYSRMMSLEDM